MSAETSPRDGADTAGSDTAGAASGRTPAVSRRRLLTAAGLTGAAAAGAAAVHFGEKAPTAVSQTGFADAVVPFHGKHQAGITTAQQDRLHIAAFDLITDSKADVRLLLKDWTEAIREMAQGNKLGSGAESYAAPPADTGEAMGLSAAHLTVTVGFGRSFFDKEFLGIRDQLPDEMEALPKFPGEKLDPARSDGDIVVQACADDPQVAVHAIRNLARIGAGVVNVRWSQLGFGRTASTSRAQATPRNLFGFKDGTANLRSEDSGKVEEHVWAKESSPAWLRGGTFMVTRRIRMHIEVWDSASLQDQELTTGRTKTEGAPLSGGTEFTEPDFAKKSAHGPAIPVDSHVHLAHPTQNKGVQMLRRGYNYTDGTDGLGRLDAGLFFIAFVTDPRTHFTPMQMAMSRGDRMHKEYLQHQASGLFAIPAGVKDEQDWIGRALLG